MTAQNGISGLPELDIIADYARFTLRISRYLVVFVGIIALPMLVIWLSTARYAQLVFWLLLAGPLFGAALLYPSLYRRGRVRLGLRLFVTAMMSVAVLIPFLRGGMLHLSGVLSVVVVLLANLLLARRTALIFTGLTVIAFAANGLMLTLWTPPWAVIPMVVEIEALFNAGLGLLLLTMATLIVRVVVHGQQAQVTRANEARREVERQIAIQQEQHAQLEEARQALEASAAFEKAQNEYQHLLIEQTREASTSVNAAAAEILAAVTEQMASVSQQQAAITQTLATVEEVQATVTQTAERAQIVAAAASHSVDVSQDGADAVSDTIAGMIAVQAKVDTIAETIMLLADQTQQIGEVISTVNEIADQSRMLALNASIEAARAGEHGRGFLVVAAEVRQLAEQSRRATDRIREILGEIQQATNAAVLVTEEGSQGAEGGVQLVGRAGEAIESLADILGQSAQAAAQIAASTNQQATGMDQLVMAMHSIRDATVNTEISARQSGESARSLNDMARQMQAVISRKQPVLANDKTVQ